MNTDWREGEPRVSGYYLATWLMGSERPVVSELWFNPTGGGGCNWWSSRGYLGERRFGMDGAVRDVIAWMPLPNPVKVSQAQTEAATRDSS